MPEELPAERSQLIDSLMAAQRQLRALAASDHGNPLFSINLTMQQLRLLLVVSIQGPRSSQELTHELKVSPATVTGLVDRLVAHGYVQRREDPNDRRIRRIEPTKEGHELIARLDDAGSTHFRGLLDRLDAEDLLALDRVIRRLVELAHEEKGTSP
ncbi:MarR family transcriptional regulator [Crossiella sp. CA-258035]|uniref:MarR family winged helix-turn-helix transcriptional regulator n=1 Tax=Crossiella sp. CA-258035 TaxID=2981138 RepID=UPI0024BD0C86|nr:MarR family transcriptional regulator [Crossiella sp. CA-258035]WHT16609.1 MarR family transcriptional regulator [Crossiella sp. CA-258035]